MLDCRAVAQSRLAAHLCWTAGRLRSRVSLAAHLRWTAGRLELCPLTAGCEALVLGDELQLRVAVRFQPLALLQLLLRHLPVVPTQSDVSAQRDLSTHDVYNTASVKCKIKANTASCTTKLRTCILVHFPSSLNYGTCSNHHLCQICCFSYCFQADRDLPCARLQCDDVMVGTDPRSTRNVSRHARFLFRLFPLSKLQP